MERILVAGATGHVGRHLVPILRERGYWVRALVWRPQAVGPMREKVDEVFRGDLRQPISLSGACEEVDSIISAAGASVSFTDVSNRDEYTDVDYTGNLNLLQEARKYDVKRFVYVSLYGADKLTGLSYVDAHENFVHQLRQAGGINAQIVRPTGFFASFADLFRMAKIGVSTIPGEGECKTNPIHEADVAKVCADALQSDEGEIAAGGPEIFTRREIAEMPFRVLGKEPRVLSMGPWLVNPVISLMKPINARIQALAEFAAGVSSIDCVAPQVGAHTLREYFEALARGPAQPVA